MKRTRSSNNDIGSICVFKENRSKLAIEIINEVESELNEVKIIYNKSIEDFKLLNHIDNTLKNLNLIKNEAIKKIVSNESIEYLKELEEDFLDEIYEDISILNKDDEGYVIVQDEVNYIDDDYENHPYTF